jgi:hypothetical protein
MENVQKVLADIYAETKGYMRVKITLKQPKVVSKFTRAVKRNLRYDEQGRLVGYTKQREPKKEYILYLKMSSRGFVCLSNRENARYIYPYYSLFSDTEIESIDRVSSKTTEKDWDRINRNYIINNTDENLWNNFVHELKTNTYDGYLLKENSGRRIRTVSMSSKFPQWVCERLEECIRKKEKFHYSTRGLKRDISVSLEMGADGIFRGWYSSEYSGCGNGAYYLLINSKTAIFCEYD